MSAEKFNPHAYYWQEGRKSPDSGHKHGQRAYFAMETEWGFGVYFAMWELSKEIAAREAGVPYEGLAWKYRNGMTTRELVEEYRKEIEEMDQSLSDSSKRVIIMTALACLIPADERGKIGKKHMKTNGRNTRAGEKGFFALGPDAQQTARLRGLTTQRESGSGVCGYKPQQRIEFGRRRAIMQGKDVMSDEEREFFLELINDPKNLHKTGPNKGKLDYDKIGRTMEENGYKRKTGSSYKSLVHDLKRRGKNSVC